jgi:colanic acid/amylovoran biosynthesis protein
MRTAIIVPGVTDLNKGDQALVWETHRLVHDMQCFDQIYIVSTGDTPQERELLCGQSEAKGYQLVETLLKHPRRGQHNDSEVIQESLTSFGRLALRAVLDFCSQWFLLAICRSEALVSFFYSKQTAQSVRQFRSAEVLFVKGGGFIHAYGEKTAPYLMWFFLFYVRLGKALGKKVVFLPNSYGPFQGFTVANQVKSVFATLDKVYAREALSAQKLGELMGRSIPVSPDLGFYLQMDASTDALELLNRYGLDPAQQKLVGITIRPWRFPGLSNPEQLYANYLESVKSLAIKLVESGYQVVFCNQSIGPNAHEDDRNAIKEVLHNWNHPAVHWIDENLPCDVLKSVYSHFYAFVGTRFHSVIFSLTSCVPSIAIGYGGNKAKGIMADFNMPDYTIPIESVSAYKLQQLFSNLEASHAKIQVLLADHNVNLQRKRTELLLELKTLIR